MVHFIMNVITYACWNLMYPHRELPIAWWRHGMETFGALGVHRLPKLWLSIHTGQLRNDHDGESNQVHLSFFSLSGKTSYSRDLVRASAVLLPRRLSNLKPLYIHIAKFRDSNQIKSNQISLLPCQYTIWWKAYINSYTAMGDIEASAYWSPVLIKVLLKLTMAMFYIITT